MFFESTINKIVGDLETKVTKLLAHAEDLKSKAEDKLSRASLLITESNQHQAEADRATRIAGKVKAILD